MTWRKRHARERLALTQFLAHIGNPQVAFGPGTAKAPRDGGGSGGSPVADTGGGQTRPMPPPLTNKDTPPVHCNEFNCMSSATHCRSSCRPRPVVRIKYHP